MGEPLSLQQALQRMRDLDVLDRTGVWPGGEIPQWVTDDMATKGIQQTSAAPVLWAIHSWPQIARTLRTEVTRLREHLQRTKAALNTALYWYDCDGAADGREGEEIDGCRLALRMAQDALDQAAPQEVEGVLTTPKEFLTCTACGRTLRPCTPDGGHNPNCPWLADARRDGTEGRQ